MSDSSSKIVSAEEIKRICQDIRRNNKKIVTTNGAFDILHAGHATSLAEAAKQGDILIVGLNSDASVRAYKSADRPIIPENYRAELLAALECVDYVVILNEPDISVPLIRLVKPDVHVKSKSGYKGFEGPVLNEYGGELHLLEDIPSISTTQIIDKILDIAKKEKL